MQVTSLSVAISKIKNFESHNLFHSFETNLISMSQGKVIFIRYFIKKERKNK